MEGPAYGFKGGQMLYAYVLLYIYRQTAHLSGDKNLQEWTMMPMYTGALENTKKNKKMSTFKVMVSWGWVALTVFDNSWNLP